MQGNDLDKVKILENQLLLYVSDPSPDEEWHHFAEYYNWQIFHHNDLLSALGAFVMLMPGIVVVDRRSAKGNAVLSHIEDVLHMTPQSALIIIELGVQDCVARYGSVVRLGAASDASPADIFQKLK